ncbi:MAG: 2-hydroxyacid dehydrogenase [Sporolactobacillus sp.]|nr:2-hydroxyacid dehydrogenase [Sporolactobacillus sp.]
MNILAFGDNLITVDMLEDGLTALAEEGHDVTVRHWVHDSVESLQNDNLLIEQKGANAVQVPNSLVDDIDRFDVIITQFTPIGKKLIDKASHLKYIGVLRGGIENIDKEYAEKRGIKVINTPGRNARAVAEFTVGMMLSETRNIARTYAAMKKGIWLKDFPNKSNIPEIGGKTIGIAGFGHIGKLVAKFLKSFDAKIIFYDKYVNDNMGYTRVDSLGRLMQAADIVTIHMRLTNETHHIINGENLTLMKPTAYLINTARSGLIDEKALLDVLKNKRIMGAAIDTFDEEPLPVNSPFLELDNVTVTSHLAGSTADAFKNTPKLFSKLLLKELKN